MWLPLAAHHVVVPAQRPHNDAVRVNQDMLVDVLFGRNFSHHVRRRRALVILVSNSFDTTVVTMLWPYIARLHEVLTAGLQQKCGVAVVVLVRGRHSRIKQGPRHRLASAGLRLVAGGGVCADRLLAEWIQRDAVPGA